MGANKNFGGFRDGELPLDADVLAGTDTYFGGQPAAINPTNGGVTVCKTGKASYLGGVLANSAYEDKKIGNATVLYGGSKVTLINGSNSVDTVVDGNTVEGAPYDTAQTYAAGDLLYVKGDGKWTNQSGDGIATNGGGGATAKAIVLKPATTSDGNMDIYLLPTI